MNYSKKLTLSIIILAVIGILFFMGALGSLESGLYVECIAKLLIGGAMFTPFVLLEDEE